MTIYFGGMAFMYPARISNWSPKPTPGVYCVCVADPSWQPEPFRPIFFGATDNLSDSHLLHANRKHEAWLAHAGSLEILFVANIELADFSPLQRQLFAAQLVSQYRTPFNQIEPLPDIELPSLTDRERTRLESLMEEEYA